MTDEKGRFTLEHHFGGTARKEEYINEVYGKWKSLSISQRKDPVRLMKIGFLSYQKAKDEYLPLFRMMLADEEEEEPETQPETKIIHLGRATKRVPIKKEPSPPDEVKESRDRIDAQQARHNAMMEEKKRIFSEKIMALSKGESISGNFSVSDEDNCEPRNEFQEIPDDPDFLYVKQEASKDVEKNDKEVNEPYQPVKKAYRKPKPAKDAVKNQKKSNEV